MRRGWEVSFETMDYATLEKSNHFKQHHPTPHTQSTRHLDAWSLKNENVHSSQHFPHPVILRGAEGEVAESNKQSCLQIHTAVRPQCKMKVLPVQDLSEPNNASSHLHPIL